VENTTLTPAPRTPLLLEVSYKRSYARETSLGIIKNISLSGAFLEIDASKMRADEKLNIIFSVAGRERKVAGHVVWANSHGCGVKFTHHNNRDIQIVDDLIYFVENERSESRSVMDSIFKKVG
jgi:hypothetical protein